jgi:hypothetical protein
VTPALHGQTWTVRVRVNGKQTRVKLCHRSEVDGMSKVQKQAYLQSKVQQVLVGVNAGSNPNLEPVAPEHLTVKVAGDSWLHQSKTRHRGPISENTARIYAHYLNRWIYPVVGSLLLSELKSKNAKRVIERMKENDASSSVMNDVAVIMGQVLASVIDKDMDGPVYHWKLSLERMDVPEVEETEGKAFTSKQVEEIISRAPGQYKVLFALLAACGLRDGEVLAIEIGADSEKCDCPINKNKGEQAGHTTLSKDCRTVYVNGLRKEKQHEEEEVWDLLGIPAFLDTVTARRETAKGLEYDTGGSVRGMDKCKDRPHSRRRRIKSADVSHCGELRGLGRGRIRT